MLLSSSSTSVHPTTQTYPACPSPRCSRCTRRCSPLRRAGWQSAASVAWSEHRAPSPTLHSTATDNTHSQWYLSILRRTCVQRYASVSVHLLNLGLEHTKLKSPTLIKSFSTNIERIWSISASVLLRCSPPGSRILLILRVAYWWEAMSMSHADEPNYTIEIRKRLYIYNSCHYNISDFWNVSWFKTPYRDQFIHSFHNTTHTSDHFSILYINTMSPTKLACPQYFNSL